MRQCARRDSHPCSDYASTFRRHKDTPKVKGAVVDRLLRPDRKIWTPKDKINWQHRQILHGKVRTSLVKCQPMDPLLGIEY